MMTGVWWMTVLVIDPGCLWCCWVVSLTVVGVVLLAYAITR